jgi:hypothetical protein
LGASPADDVVLYPRVQGEPLARRLWAARATTARRLTAAGRLLRAIHQDPGALAADLERHDLAGEVASVARAAEHLGPLVPDTAAEVHQLLDLARDLDTLTRTLAQPTEGDPR